MDEQPGFNVILIKKETETPVINVDSGPSTSLLHLIFPRTGSYMKWPDLKGCSESTRYYWTILENEIFPTPGELGYLSVDLYDNVCDDEDLIATLNKCPPIHLLWPEENGHNVPKGSALWYDLQNAMVKFIEEMPPVYKQIYRLDYMTERM